MIVRFLLGRARAMLLRLRGATVGSRTSVGSRLVVRHAAGIRLGSRVEIEHDVYLKLVTATARLEVGDFTFIGRGCEFDVAQSVAIGAHSLIAPNVFITDHTHNHARGRLLDEQGIRAAPVTIGSDVWIGTGAVILAGVGLGDGAIVGAGAVVTRDVAPNTIVGGIPARVLGERA